MEMIKNCKKYKLSWKLIKYKKNEEISKELKILKKWKSWKTISNSGNLEKYEQLFEKIYKNYENDNKDIKYWSNDIKVYKVFDY